MISLPPLPYDVPSDVMQKASTIKLALFDVDGVSWLSLTYEGNNVYYSFLENTTGLDRTTNTTITNTETLEVVEILVTQYA